MSGIIVGMGSANERRRYNVTSIPIARAHDEIDRICPAAVELCKWMSNMDVAEMI